MYLIWDMTSERIRYERPGVSSGNSGGGVYVDFDILSVDVS
jgi:hypothetical protein